MLVAACVPRTIENEEFSKLWHHRDPQNGWSVFAFLPTHAGALRVVCFRSRLPHKSNKLGATHENASCAVINKSALLQTIIIIIIMSY
jgi:hypothetical protein